MRGGNVGFQAPHNGGAHGHYLLAGALGLVDYVGRLLGNNQALGVHPVLGKVFHIYGAELADAHVHGNEGFLDVLQDHAVEQFPAEVQAGGGSAHGTLVRRKDGLIVLRIFRGNLLLHPFGHVGLSQGEKGLFEVLVGTVEEEAERTAAGGGVVNHLRHQALVLAEIQLVADADLAGGINNHVPQPLFPVQLPQEQHHNIGTGLFLFAVQTGRKYLGVVEHKGVSFAEIVDDILELAVLQLAGVFVEDHHARLVPPAGRFLGNAVLAKVEVKLGQFHTRTMRYLYNTAVMGKKFHRYLPMASSLAWADMRSVSDSPYLAIRARYFFSSLVSLEARAVRMPFRMAVLSSGCFLSTASYCLMAFL